MYFTLSDIVHKNGARMVLSKKIVMFALVGGKARRALEWSTY
jgi:hypothetical protein